MVEFATHGRSIQKSFAACSATGDWPPRHASNATLIDLLARMLTNGDACSQNETAVHFPSPLVGCCHSIAGDALPVLTPVETEEPVVVPGPVEGNCLAWSHRRLQDEVMRCMKPMVASVYISPVSHRVASAVVYEKSVPTLLVSISVKHFSHVNLFRPVITCTHGATVAHK